MKKIFFLLCGHFFLVIGVIGVFLPILPTTPFLLLSAYFYSKSSGKIYYWMMNHKLLGPPLQDWQHHGVIGIKAKVIAASMMIYVLAFRFPKLAINIYAKGFACTVLVCVLVFVLTRPSKRE